jgi:hypothetical protein
MLRIERVHPAEFAGIASEILRSAWKPPCLDYSAEYVRWQLSFPSPLPPIALMAFQDSTPVGFVAATGRRMRINEKSLDVYLSSFLSVKPGINLPSLAMTLVRKEGRFVVESGIPLLVFAKPESSGELLLKGFESVGLKRSSVGMFRIHMAQSRPSVTITAKEVDGDVWLRLHHELGVSRPSQLAEDFSAASVAHHAQDPGRRRFAAAYGEDSQVKGLAILGSVRSLTAAGAKQSLPALHHVSLSPHLTEKETQSEVLKALIELAAGSEKIVTLPNASMIQPDVLKAAGFRSTASAFRGYIFSSDLSYPILNVDTTDFEIV